VSSKPFVVITPARASVPSTTAFSATVVEWRKSSVSASRSAGVVPSWSAATVRESMIPDEKSGGVENALPSVTAPSASTTTQSVQVPPMSMPTT
jgi:hypothetical protein